MLSLQTPLRRLKTGTLPLPAYSSSATLSTCSSTHQRKTLKRRMLSLCSRFSASYSISHSLIIPLKNVACRQWAFATHAQQQLFTTKREGTSAIVASKHNTHPRKILSITTRPIGMTILHKHSGDYSGPRSPFAVPRPSARSAQMATLPVGVRQRYSRLLFSSGAYIQPRSCCHAIHIIVPYITTTTHRDANHSRHFCHRPLPPSRHRTHNPSPGTQLSPRTRSTSSCALIHSSEKRNT